ncbi:MAG: hypothetical protein RQ751_02575 [Longimicrobiales bacterium]|nr:hypothetical protein [Longimicrobiales bacterium]
MGNLLGPTRGTQTLLPRSPAMRLLVVPLLLPVLSALPLRGQDAGTPAGWLVRADAPDADAAEVFFVDMPPGWHVTTGPAVLLWSPDSTATGEFRFETETFLFDPEGGQGEFGIMLGGRGLQEPDALCTYFLIREGGEFAVVPVRGRVAASPPEWTSHPAVARFADRPDGDVTVRNVLAVEVSQGDVRFLVNGREVARRPRTDLALDGAFGLRVGRGVNLHVTRLDIRDRG